MTSVVIGIDPHKGSHTAVAVDAAEAMLGTTRLVSNSRQVDQLLQWARRWPERTWAIEGARGLGHLLAQQLLVAGEEVVDVQPKLAARVRLLNTGDVNKNDPNDARSVAIAALRATGNEPVMIEDQTAVLRMWSRRYRDLSSLRTQVMCRLHTVLCELVPGGFSKELSVGQANSLLYTIEASTPAASARLELAHDLVADLQRIDTQRREVRRRLNLAVAASGSSLTDMFGVGPLIAATVLGYVRDIRRFPSRDHFAAYNGTAPIEASSGNRKIYRLSRRGNRQMNYVIHMAAVSQIRQRHSEGRAYYDRKVAEGMTGKSALRALKRKISDSMYAHMTDDARRHHQRVKDPGGQTGNDSASSATGSHPAAPALRRSHSRANTNTRTDPTPASIPPRPKPRQHS